MLATTDKSLTVVAEEWLARFERALASPADLRDLFRPDSHWRDVLALTWHIRTVDGVDAVTGELAAQAGRAKAAGFRIDPARTAPRKVTRAGTEALEAIFRFETAEGHGGGVVRLTPDVDGTCKAWTLHTALDALKGPRGEGRAGAADGLVLFARLPRPQLARSAEVVRGLCGPRSGGAGGGRRAGRALGRRAAHAVAASTR